MRLSTTAVHVLGAGEALGLESCRLAASVSAMGAEHQQRPARVECPHVDEAAAIAREAVEADYDGHESFWAVADTTAGAPTARLAEEFFPAAERRADPAGHEALFDRSEAESLLGWTPERGWRDY